MEAPARRWITRSIAAPAVIALVIAAGFVGLRLFILADGDVTRFVVAGDVLTDRDQAPDDLFIHPNVGYDGQFYYRLALDPFNFDRTAFGITIDDELRHDRILYPALVRVVSLGWNDAVPWAMVLVNIAAIGAIGLCGAALARDSGRAPLWGLLFLSFPLLFFSLGRDLTEPLEVALVLAGFLALRHERWWWAAFAFSGAVLTREPAVVIVIAVGAERVFSWLRSRTRPGVPDVAWIVPGLVFASWQAVIRIETGRFGFTGGDADVTAPFFGLHKFLDRSRDVLHGLHVPGVLQDAEAFVLLFVVVLAVVALRSTSATAPERWAFVASAVFASAFFGAGAWLAEGASRAFADLYALAILVLLGTRWRLTVPAVVAGSVSLFAAVQLLRVV